MRRHIPIEFLAIKVDRGGQPRHFSSDANESAHRVRTGSILNMPTSDSKTGTFAVKVPSRLLGTAF